MIFIAYAIIIFLFLIPFRKRNNSQTEALFTKKDTTQIKGFSALLVILHHLGQDFNVKEYDIFNINYDIGHIAVGIFLTLSAYGLIKSALNDEKYFKKIFFVKIPILYLYQIFVNTIYYFSVFKTSNMPLSESLIKIFNLEIFFNYKRLNGYSWFITTILIIYILIGLSLLLKYLLKNKINNKKLFLAISSSVIIIAFYLTIKFTPAQDIYARSIFCFLLGVIAGLYEKELLTFLKDKTCFLITILYSIILFVVFKCINSGSGIALISCLLLITTFSKLTSGDNALYTFLGNISVEIYLFQLLFFYKIKISPEIIKLIAILGSTIITAYLFNLLHINIIKLLKKCFNLIKHKTTLNKPQY